MEFPTWNWKGSCIKQNWFYRIQTFSILCKWSIPVRTLYSKMWTISMFSLEWTNTNTLEPFSLLDVSIISQWEGTILWFLYEVFEDQKFTCFKGGDTKTWPWLAPYIHHSLWTWHILIQIQDDFHWASTKEVCYLHYITRSQFWSTAYIYRV